MNMKEKTLSVDKIFDGRIIKVHNDIVELPNGAKANREVVDHPGGVMIAPMTDDDELIFVRQFRYPHKRVVLELPAGKLEYGENPLEAGIRELSEEVGATAEKIVPLGKIIPTPAYCGEVIYMYCASSLKFGEQHLDEDEFLEIEKIPLDKAVEMVMNNEISDAKTVAGVLKIKYLKEHNQF